MAANYDVLTKAINAAIYEQMAKFKDTITGKICTKIEDDGSRPYEWFGMTPRMAEFMGEVKYSALIENTLTIKNKNWMVGLEADVKDLSRDRLGRYKEKIQELAAETILHPWELAITLLENGHVGTYGLAYDGQYFYDTDHVDKGAEYTTSQSNDLTASASTPSSPTLAEVETAFSAAVTALAQFKDDRGRIFHRDYNGGLLVVAPWNMRDVFRKFLHSEQIPGPAGGVVKNPNFEAADLHVDAQLSTTNVFHLLKINRPFKPLILQYEKINGKEWRVEHTRPDENLAVTYDKIRYAVKGTYNMGYGQWRNAVRVEFS